MCLAVPARLVSREGTLGKVEVSGVRRDVSLMLLPEANIGDYVLVHAGFAMQIIDETAVKERDALVAEMHGAPRTVMNLSEGAAANYG